MIPQAHPNGPSRGHRSKILVALLAAVLGVFSAHWWYLGRRHAWLATLAGCGLAAWAATTPVWWDSPAFFLLVVPMTAGFIESLVFALKPDAWFDARYNPGSEQRTRTGWAPVFVAMFSLLAGSVALMFMISLIALHVYQAMGWLDGYTL